MLHILRPLPSIPSAHRQLAVPLLRLLLPLFFILCLASPSLSADDHRHFLWRVSSSTNHIYLVGSIHLLRQENYPLPAVYQETFAETSTLVLEADPAEMELPATQAMTREKALFPPGMSLRQTVSASTYQATSRAAQELGLDISALNRYRPWFVSITLTNIMLQQLGFDPAHGIDMHFYQQAMAAGHRIEALESSAYQVDLFASMPPSTQDLLLQQALEDLHTMEAEFQLLINAWQQGDDNALAKLLLDSFAGFPEILDRLITNRNNNWLHHLESLLQGDKPAFVVVGAGHLLGSQGLVRLLAERGYRMQQL